ncbi:tripartite tricarboxylate transporter substrate binding protein [Pseudorhodoferax sp. Leaf274]|uniref:Bug family tripartite tricarboxylate transporter substrate binding protein n=1 Tax=Pseudorhodoferax sp. Leaf274 TaxID=1736318 RepID=UPI000AFACE1A|nr:tripartite tricarboxylate transporter substrate binding protein [Pseudorhodoferax sp. Leaf274]
MPLHVLPVPAAPHGGRRRRALCAATLALPLAFAAGLAPAGAAAQSDRPYKLLVPYAPGGVTDQLARLVAGSMATQLGQPVVVDNKPGANTIIAVDALMREPADGHTLLMGAGSTMVLNPLLIKKLSYQPRRDLRMLSVVVDTPMVMVVPAALPPNNVAEFRRYVQANPDKVNYASVGVGGSLHLAGELFAQKAGVAMTHVAYKGSVPAVTDLIGGQVQLMFDAPATSLPQVKAGKLKALAVTTRERMPLLPDVPTVGETLPGFDAALWFGVIVREGTPPAVAARLKAAVDQALLDPALRQAMEAQGNIVRKPQPQEEINAFLAREEAQWAALIKAGNISLD